MVDGTGTAKGGPPGYDTDRLRECMFDPETAPALAELESGPKSVGHLAEACGISGEEMKGRLAYMVECGFLSVDGDAYSADAGKLAAFMEDDEAGYGSIVDSLTTMDSYLN